MTIFFTSDTHFGHANIIKFCSRPFKDASHMNQMLINNWNSVVKAEDTVYHLGDFGFAHPRVIEGIIRQLNGTKFLIFGNHDKTIKANRDLQELFGWCKDYHELYVPDLRVKGGRQLAVLHHYAGLVWNKSHYGSWMLHGHSHGTLKYPYVGRIMDVGVDPLAYHPISYEQVRTKLLTLKPVSVDHHAHDNV